MYRISPTKRFEKTLSRLRRSGDRHTESALKEVLVLLATHDNRALFVLTKRWKDHTLKGRLQGMRELHLGFNSLLLYRVYEEDKSIDLLDIVTHDELEKM